MWSNRSLVGSTHEQTAPLPAAVVHTSSFERAAGAIGSSRQHHSGVHPTPSIQRYGSIVEAIFDSSS